MTSTSFHPPQPGSREHFRHIHEVDFPTAEGSAASHSQLAPLNVHTAEAKRMKAFAGQRQFQAPVADDFSRGMLAAGQPPGDDGKSLRRTGLINGLTAWWRGQKLD